jgi:hypothetical protein
MIELFNGNNYNSDFILKMPMGFPNLSFEFKNEQ